MRENRTQKSDAESGRGARLDVSRVLTEYRGLLCYIIRPIVGDENLIEDCFSEISEIIILKYDAYYDENKGSLTAWLSVRGLHENFTKISSKKGSIRFWQEVKRPRRCSKGAAMQQRITTHRRSS